jgi:2-amino-4-hydroxy-6-hydroxymethyldihydropteridine diphosphokinase
MSRAVLSIGSNLGDRLASLQGVVDALRAYLVAVSPVYETAPWGPVPQGDYLNAVLVADDPAAAPADWLQRAHEYEQAADRVRDVRWGPRTLDVDIVSVDAVRSDDPGLTLPHPQAAQRAFVLVPWRAAEGDAQLDGRRVADLVAALPRAELDGVHLRADLALR